MTLRAAADLAQRSFPFFLRFVLTKDEAEADPKQRVKPMPVESKPYITHCAQVLQNEPVVWVPKSRRMIMTWLHSAELVWQALTPHSHLFVQQTKEDDSDWLVRERCMFIWDHLPEWLRFYAMDGKGVQASYKFCKMSIPNGSQIWGVAQGPEQFRKFTPSGIFSDEVAVQDSFRDAQTAIMPLAEKGCRVRFVSSARGGTQFDAMVNGPKLPGTVESPVRGIRQWRLINGGYVLRVHYTADPEKDPERDGAAWVEKIAGTFDGGREGSDWRQEMEIDFMAKSGTLVYDNWDPERHVVPPFTDEFLSNHDGPFWRALDYGKINPTACLWVTEYDGCYYVYREFYKAGLSPAAIKEEIHKRSNEGRYAATWIDPRAGRQETTDSDSALFMLNHGEFGLGAVKANSSATGRDYIRQWLSEGRFKVTSDCTNFISEIEGYVHEEWTTATAERHNQKEAVRKKDDHCMDAAKYFANGVQYREALRDRAPSSKVTNISDAYRSRRERILNPVNKRYAGRTAVMRGYHG